MAKAYHSIQVKKSGASYVVLGLGQAPRGTKYIKGKESLTIRSFQDPDWPQELQDAIDALYA